MCQLSGLDLAVPVKDGEEVPGEEVPVTEWQHLSPPQGTGMAGGHLIGFKAICIPLVGEVIVFPILQSPPDERLIFRTCQLHTAWEFLH